MVPKTLPFDWSLQFDTSFAHLVKDLSKNLTRYFLTKFLQKKICHLHILSKICQKNIDTFAHLVKPLSERLAVLSVIWTYFNFKKTLITIIIIIIILNFSAVKLIRMMYAQINHFFIFFKSNQIWIVIQNKPNLV